MPDNIRVTYFDTAMVLIEVDGVRLLTDPVLDHAGSAFDYGPVHLEKTSSASVAPDELGHIDAVLLSHDQHGDNLDRAGRALLSRVPRVLTTPEGASRLGGVAEGLSDWQSATVEGAAGGVVTVAAVPAQHGPDGTQEATGPVTGFVITTDDRTTIYVSGDTIPFAGTDEIASRYAPVDLAILNLGCARIDALGDLKVSLSADEAIRYAQALGARRVFAHPPRGLGALHGGTRPGGERFRRIGDRESYALAPQPGNRRDRLRAPGQTTDRRTCGR